MIKRTTTILAAGLAIALMLLGCRSATPLPTPLASLTDADRTAIAAGRPTLPPTFTPSATWTPTRTFTPDEAETPTPTVSLTPTSLVEATRTRIPPPSATPTWTPDTDVIIPTSGPPVGGNTATPFPGFTPGSAGTMTATVAAGTNCGSTVAQNLLQNGGFEGPVYRERYSQVDAPESWIPFWKPEGSPVTYDPDNGDGYKRPQFAVITNVAPNDNPPRVMAGSKAVSIFGQTQVFDAGFYQVVAVAPGDTLCLIGSAHGWSQHQSDDRSTSRQTSEDDRQNMNFMLGIDPTGNIDPFASTVVWGQTAHIFDKYAAIPGVQAKAQVQSITIFIRGYNKWRFDHNEMFFDEMRLIRSVAP
jgi:hypothetical protein